MSWMFHIVLFFLTAGLGNIIYFIYYLFSNEKPVSGGERVTPVSYAPTLSSTNFQSSAMANYNQILNKHLSGAEQANNASVQAAVAQTMAERQAYEEEQRKLTVSNSGGVAGSILGVAGKLAKANYNMVQNQKNMTYTYKCFSCKKLQQYSSAKASVKCACGRQMHPQ